MLLDFSKNWCSQVFLWNLRHLTIINFAWPTVHYSDVNKVVGATEVFL